MSKHRINIILSAIFFLLTMSPLLAKADVQPLPNNLSPTCSYVLSRTMTAADSSSYLDHVDYDNGLGHPFQRIDVGITPNREDLVTLYEYDIHGRPLRSWLPSLGSGGSCVNVSTLKQSASALYGGDTAPYTWTVYEQSPLNRLSEEYLPGVDWHQKGKKKTHTYNENALDVVEMTMEGEKLYFYKSRTYTPLIPKEVRDEAGTLHVEYKDADGRLVVTSDRPPFADLELTTYYVYDDAGHLRFVLTPEAYHQISVQFKTTTFVSPDIELLRRWCYEYRYDGRGNCIFKRLPDCEPVYYIYDKADRCIFSQNGEQRLKGQWSYTIPDVFGRTVLTGTCHNVLNFGTSLDTVITALRSDYRGDEFLYAVINLTLIKDTVYTATYYDDYNLFGRNGLPKKLKYAAPPSNVYGICGLTAPKGLVTGTVTAKINEGSVKSYLYSTFYYDDQGRVIQTRENLGIKGYDYTYNGYDFMGHIVKQYHMHKPTGKTEHIEVYTHTYDHAGRLLSTTHQLDSGSEVTIKANTYDELCRLSSCSQNGNLTTSYTYNVRSWLTGVTTDTLFSERLYYNESHGGSTPDYCGNISAMEWQTDAKRRGYSFIYDYHSRLKQAIYSENGEENGHYDTFYTYDRMGNITSLRRNGLIGGESYGTIDDLIYNYSGNRVISLEDDADNEDQPVYSGAFHFRNGSSASAEYAYDRNGNVTKDLNKGISSIKYDLLNLPTNIAYDNGNTVTYTYSATGKKLATSYYLRIAGEGDEYCGNFIYHNGSLRWILFDGGYVSFRIGMAPEYHFFLKDHLGNNRMVVSADGIVEQVNHFYPYGGLFGESTGSDQQRYKYNDKELDRMNGIDWYDYGARFMDGVRGQFTTMDPLAEQYYSISPYAYCTNNPLKFIDLDGRKVFLAKNVSYTFKEDYEKTIRTFQEKGCDDVWRSLNESQEIYTIIENKGNSNFFDSSTNTISWNSRTGLYTNKDVYISPATRLNHELGHALHYDKDPKQYIEDKNTPTGSNDKTYTKEERHVIEEIETKTAECLGEIEKGGVTRNDHCGIPFSTNSPISNKSVCPIEVIIYPRQR